MKRRLERITNADNAFTAWFATLPIDTRRQIEDTHLLIVLEASFEKGRQYHRFEETAGLDLIERNLRETLSDLETIRRL